ncbi:MAG: RNA polymerase sigma-70 factor, ECF subfamily [Candidatus Magasanikbacteria bacterium GW2011_GWA2_37_8]|uniref:RNA polymerase sigma-70 factor, ECF subfamily n=1 Tax=Candidatus Magasanikbacteria bacterium GW2011_GWA2_37_8 TaxID=1619036 RepID=A0A0G0HCJ5_9BACT|nr:MAG: RNA polymerase sigma-70 factor, ECF subfamily [Candidatus Magasanikbacteria bacterium GW2011_GWA2_37_8]
MVTQDLTDEQLVAEIRKSNPELYGEIIKRYEVKLTHYLRKFIRDADELEDVLQEVFIKTYRNLYGFDVEKKFSPWIYRLAHNEAINQIKKYKKESFSLDEKEWEIVDKKIDIIGKIDADFSRVKIEEALARLDNKYRDPLVLYFFEQKSYEEISDILHIPISTVGTLILRGKNKLKDFLKK